MRYLLRLAMCAGLAAASLPAATIVSTVSDLGGGLFRYTYTVSDLILNTNDELDFRFNPAIFKSLSNAVAPAGLDPLLLQPNNPPGATGDYSLLALINNVSFASRLSVDFTLQSPGTPPGSQPFRIFRTSGLIETGNTVPPGGTLIPEPGTFTLAGWGFVAACAVLAVRRRRAVG